MMNPVHQLQFLFHPFDTVDKMDEYSSNHLDPFLIDFNREHLQFILNEEEYQPPSSSMMIEEEPLVLSQRLSQLSTETTDDGKRQLSPTTMASGSVRKKSRPDPEHLAKFDEPFPYYLQKDQSILEQILLSESSLSLDDLQSLAFFRHQMGIYQEHERLWTTFIRFGIGQLSEIDRHEIEQIKIIHQTTMPKMIYGPFWTTSIKPWLLSRPSVKALLERGAKDEQALFECAAIERLQQTRERLDHYKTEYEEKKMACLNAVHEMDTIEKRILTLVEHYGIRPFRLKIDLKLAQLKVEFREHLIEQRLKEEHPTSYQMETMQRLFELHSLLEEAKQEHIEYRERLRYNQPSPTYDTIQFAVSPTLQLLMDEKLRKELTHQYETWTARTKSNLMTIHLAIIEAKIDQYQTQIEQMTNLMWKNHHEHRATHQINSTLIHLLDQRILNMQEKFHHQFHYHIEYQIRTPFAQLENKHRRIGFISSLKIDPMAHHLFNHFTSQQLQLLQRGPNYIVPCQLHLPNTFTSNDERIKKQYSPLHQRLIRLLSKYHVPIPQQENLKAELRKEFHALFSTTTSTQLDQDQLERAIYENHIVHSIRSTLEQHGLFIRRTADHQNTFYVGEQNDFDRAIQQYMTTQTDYTLLYTIDETNRSEIFRQLQIQLRSLNMEFDKMFKEKKNNTRNL